MGMFRNKVLTQIKDLHTYTKTLTAPLLLASLLILSIFVFMPGSYGLAENLPYQVPVINGEYSGTLYVYGVPVSIVMSVTSDNYGLGHKFTLKSAQEDLFIIGGNCNCLESGAVLAEHGLFSECLGIDMGLLDQVELDGWFTEIGYRGELRLFTAGSDVSIPSLIGVFDMVRH